MDTDLGGKHNFLDNKLILTAYLNSPFNKNGVFRFVSSYSDDNFLRDVIRFSPFRAVGFDITLNFGNLKENISKKKGIQSDDLL